MADARKPTQRYLSGRVKIVNNAGLHTDRHLYVSPGEVEPNLGYPGEKSIPIADNYYQLITIQNGDAYGLCFIFPLIMWYNIIYKFDTDETFEFVTKEHGFTFIKNIEIHSSQYLLKQKNLFRFMEKIFLDYDEELRGLIFKSWSYSIKRTTTVINEYIEKKGTRFIKKLLYCIVSFIGQRRIKDKIVE